MPELMTWLRTIPQMEEVSRLVLAALKKMEEPEAASAYRRIPRSEVCERVLAALAEADATGFPNADALRELADDFLRRARKMACSQRP